MNITWKDNFAVVDITEEDIKFYSNLPGIKEGWAKQAYYERIARTGYPMDQYFRRSAKYEGHPVMTRRP